MAVFMILPNRYPKVYFLPERHQKRGTFRTGALVLLW